MKSICLGLLLATVTAPAAAQSVTTYHHTNDRHGAYKVPGLTAKAAASMHLDGGFSATVSGTVYAQPLFWHPAGGAPELIVATAANLVYALNPATGAVLWRRQLLPSVPPGDLGCTDINPEGVTGTPVIDPASATVYLDATALRQGKPRHMMYALSLSNGAVVSGWPLDVEKALTAAGVGFTSRTQGERGALLEWNGQIYAAYGGRYGDCSPYYGTVIQVDPVSHSLAGHWQTRAAGGGIWAQGGLAADALSLYVTTGNSFTSGTYGDGESVVRLKPGLARSAKAADYYAPADWLTLDNNDLDLGGTEAVPVNLVTAGGTVSPRVVALGKDGNAYLLFRNNLGGVGGHATIVPVSNDEIITEAAVYSTKTQDMVAFTNGAPIGCSTAGIMMLKLVTSGGAPVSVAWCAAYSGNGSAIITTTDGTAEPIVWVVGAEGDGLLHGFDAANGAVLFGGGGAVLSGVPHFSTILAADGRFYVGGSGRVYAYTFTHG
jgi:hypothetical protein